MFRTTRNLELHVITNLTRNYVFRTTRNYDFNSWLRVLTAYLTGPLGRYPHSGQTVGNIWLPNFVRQHLYLAIKLILSVILEQLKVSHKHLFLYKHWIINFHISKWHWKCLRNDIVPTTLWSYEECALLLRRSRVILAVVLKRKFCCGIGRFGLIRYNSKFTCKSSSPNWIWISKSLILRMQAMHQDYKQRVWNFMGSALNRNGVWLAVCVRTRPIDPELIEYYVAIRLK